MFVVAAKSRDLSVVVRRVEALQAFYRPLGARVVGTTRPWPQILIGEIEFESLDGSGHPAETLGPVPDAAGSMWIWGGPLPRELRSPQAVKQASDRDLRRFRGFGVAVAAGPDHVRLVTSPIGPTALYSSASGDATVWSTHAVAAGWIARGAVSLDATALPEFVVCEFVGAERTHLEGVRAVPPATRIDLRPNGQNSGSYWSPAERWARVPAREAFGLAESALLSSLDARLTGSEAPLCGLTSGLDSRVVALALRDLRSDAFAAYTLGAPDSPDVAGAVVVARKLGIDHRQYGFHWNSDDGARAAIEAHTRWSEGLEPIHGFARPTVPTMPSATVTGRGGETGRAFFYRFAARDRRRPRRSHLVDAVIAHRPPRLETASPDAREALRAAIEAWLDGIPVALQGDWRALDFAYGEQRLTRWDRTRLMRQQSLYVPAFDDRDVQRALLSLRLRERLRDGFHREFIRRRDASLVPAAPVAPRAAIPRPLRRVLRSVRAYRAASPRPQTWPFAPEWTKRPRTREWVAEELLGQTIIADVFGGRWATALREGFLAGEAEASRTVLVLSAPLALEQVVKRDLRHIRG